MDDLSYSADQIQQLLRCPVCLDRYTQPKLLPCQHTFCLRPCLEGLVDLSTRMIRCPECRAEHRLPTRGLQGLPNNLTIISFLDLPQPSNNRPSNNNASPATTRRNNNGRNCSSCDRELALSFCSHCESLVCDECRRTHVNTCKQDIGRLINLIRRGLPRLSDSISSLEQRSERIKQTCEAVKSEVQHSVERLIKDLKSRELMLKSEIDTFVLGEQRSLRLHQETLEVELATMASFSDCSESQLSRAEENVPVSDLISIKRQCAEHMEMLRGRTGGTSNIGDSQLPIERQPRFICDSSPLTGAISNFGELLISNSGTTSSSTTPRSLQLSATHTPFLAPGRQSRSNQPTSSSSTVARDFSQYLLRMPSSGLHGNYERFANTLASSQSSRTSPNPMANYRRNWDNPPRPRQNSPLRQSTNSSRRLTRSRDRNDSERVAGLMGGEAGANHGRNTQLHQLNHSQSRTRGNEARRSIESDAIGEVQGSANRGPSWSQGRGEGNQTRDDRAISTQTFSNHTDSQTTSATQPLPVSSSTRATTQVSAQPREPVRAPVRFDITIDESLGDIIETDLENTITFRYSTGNSNLVSTPRNNYHQKGRSVLRFGERGNEQTNFSWPRGVAVHSENNSIFVADSSNHRIQIFDDCGCFLKSIGSYGQSDGEFDCLAGVAVSASGQIVVSDRYNHRIQIFNSNGDFQLEFGEEGQDDGQMNYPWGITCDREGRIYVCDKENHRVQVFEADGTFLRKFGRLGNRPGMFENPHYVAISPDSRVYVTDSSNHRIQVFDDSGEFLFTFGIQGTQRGQVKFPKGIAVDDQGFVVVADSGNNRVQVFREDGRFFCMFGSWGSENGHFKGLEGVAIMSNGNVVVGDRENHRIQVF